MEWAEILSLIAALLVAVGLPLALSRLRKTGAKNLDELLLHLQGIGVKAQVAENAAEGTQPRPKRSWGEKAVGSIRLEGRNIESIRISGVSTQYGNMYYLDYMVKGPGQVAGEAPKKTVMARKKSPPLRGKVVDVEWKGDPRLAQRLNYDYGLKDRLLHSGAASLGGGISIHPQPKLGYTGIRTQYHLPSPEVFDAIDTIAKHVKLGG